MRISPEYDYRGQEYRAAQHNAPKFHDSLPYRSKTTSSPPFYAIDFKWATTANSPTKRPFFRIGRQRPLAHRFIRLPSTLELRRRQARSSQGSATTIITLTIRAMSTNQPVSDPFSARDTFETGAGKAGIYRL